MKKIFTLIAALFATLSINAVTIGNEDNTSDWWTAFSDAYTVNKGEKAVAKFVNHNPGTGENWFNWVLITTKANAGNPVTTNPWSVDYEYGAVRSDNFGWGTYFAKPDLADPTTWAATYENDYDWTDFLGLLNGAEVEVTIQQTDEGNLSIEAVTTKEGKTYNYKVVSKKALDAESFGFFFTVDHAHLTDFTVTIEKPAVVSNHTYDFTAWSAATAANLKADAAADIDAGWTDVEKADHSTDPMTDKCYWAVTDVNAEGQLSANGVVIEELKGLKFDATYAGKRALAIAVNYPETSLGTYAGPQYLWLGGKNNLCFTIPNVAAGSTITVCAESHKPSDARGIQLKQGDTQIGESFTPTTQATYTWTVETAGDVDVYNTNGCHIYYIDVVAGSETGVSEVKVAPVKAQPKKVLTKNGIIIGGKYTIGGALAK